MKLARHIMVARAEGPEAGMAAYLATPIAKTHTQYQEIARKRTQASRIKTYCKLFAGPLAVPDEHIGRPVGRPRKNAPVKAVVEAPSVEMGDLFAQFQAFMQGMAGTVEVEAEPEAVVVATPRKAERKTVEVNGKRVNMPAGTITAGEAWVVLNADGEFPAPRDTDKPATNGQLYRLNALGLLAIRS